jgi:crotonobetainyl-CoA:carnitine CoA-transferase CaiB-like acyl-CoA transferase
VPTRMGNAHPAIVPYQDFPTADQPLVVAVGNDAQFHRLCEVLGHPEWAVDARFATNPARVQHRHLLVPMLEECLRQQPAAQWLAQLQALGVPCGPIARMHEVFAHPQAQARGLRAPLPHALNAQACTVASPLRLSATPARPARPAPLLGEHTDEVLQEWLRE